MNLQLFYVRIALYIGNHSQTLKKIFIKGDFYMSKVKEQLKREKTTKNIFMVEDLIEDSIPKIIMSLNNYPDPWLTSVNKNFTSFLCYLQGIQEKYEKEIKPTIK